MLRQSGWEAMPTVHIVTAPLFFFLLISHAIQECANMAWAPGTYDIEGHNIPTDMISENMERSLNDCRIVCTIRKGRRTRRGLW